MKKHFLLGMALLVSTIAMSDDMNWNFSSNTVTVDGKSYYLDGENKVAQFYTYTSQLDSLLDIPATISYEGDTYTVCSMKGRSSSPTNAGKVQSVILPNTIKSIETYAFYNLSNIKDIRINCTTPPSIVSNFKSSLGNIKVYVPEGSIHAYRIADSQWTKSDIVLIDGSGSDVSVTLATAGTLSNEVIKKIDYIQEVNKLKVSGALNESDMNTIKNDMPNLISLDLSDAQLTAIPDYWMESKWGIETLTLPKVLKTIGYRAFYECYGLQAITLPEGLTKIGDYSFRRCKQLKEVSFPSTLATINYESFYDCNSLAKVNLCEGLKVIGQSAFYNTKLTSITMPSTVTEIKASAFSSTPLVTVNLNEGLEYLNSSSFGNCDSLRQITLPSTLRYCYSVPFSGCDNLKDIYVRAGLPPYCAGTCPVTASSMNNVVLHVPAMSQAAYKTQDGWRDFYTIEPMTSYRPTVFATSYDANIDIDNNLTNSNYNPTIETFRSDWNVETYGAITVNGNGAVNLSAYNAYYDYNRWFDYPNHTRPITALVNNVTMKTDKINTTLYLQRNNWAFLSFPYDIKVKDITPFNEGTTNFVVRKYSGENRAMGDMNYTWVKLNADDVIKANEGFIINLERLSNGYSQSYGGLYMPSADKEITIASGDVKIPLTAYPSEFTQNQGWNLIGNPYMCYYDTRFMDFTAPITVWSMRNNSYTAYSPTDDSYVLCPGEAFFVQCSGNGKSITFSKDGRQTNHEARTIAEARSAVQKNCERKIINIVLSDGERSDRTRIVLNENASASYELDKDAAKFISEEAPQIYSTGNGVRYAINERPAGNGIIALEASFIAGGAYTISLADNVDVDIALIDTEAGKSVSLREAKTYAFTASQGKSSRFVLQINGQTNGIEELNSDASDTSSASYNLAGQRINSKAANTIVIKNGKKMLVK